MDDMDDSKLFLAAQVSKPETVVKADHLLREAVAALQALPHAQYLQTEHWRDFRDGMLRLHRTCQHCDSREHREVHHLSYDFLGRERAGDVLVLCRGCHEAWHREHASRPLARPEDDIVWWAGQTRLFGRFGMDRPR